MNGPVRRPVMRGARRFARKSARVTVIAPHPDDDVIGCGGILQRLAARGARICIVYVTDGSASHVRSKRFPPPVLRDIREREARAALAVLGVPAKTIFLRAPDGRLAELEATRVLTLRSALAHCIKRHGTQLLFVPWPHDPHPDHIATARLVDAALARSARRPATYRYGVWLPVRGAPADQPDAVINRPCGVRLTAPEVARKRAAIMAHRSQSSDLIDDDPQGFRIDEALLTQWLAPVEQFYRDESGQNGCAGS